MHTDLILGWVRGRIPAGGSRKKYMDRLARNLKVVDSYAAEKQVRIMIEVINRYEINTFNTAEEVMTFLEQYDLPNCYAHLDTFHMGIAGAALATVVSQTVSAVWVLAFLRSRHAPLRLRRLLIDRAQLRSIVKLGLTGFTFRVTNSLTQALVNIMLKSWGGAASTLYIGAMSLINSIREIISLPNGGVVAGGQSVMSYNYGAKQYRRVAECIRFIFLCGLFVNIAMWALIMFAPRLVISLFTTDGELIGKTVECARIYFGAFPFMALQQTGQTTFVALNRPKQALIFSMLRKVVLVAPLTLLLPGAGLGVNGVFWAELISQVTGASLCFITMYMLIWREMKAAEN